MPILAIGLGTMPILAIGFGPGSGSDHRADAPRWTATIPLALTLTPTGEPCPLALIGAPRWAPPCPRSVQTPRCGGWFRRPRERDHSRQPGQELSPAHAQGFALRGGNEYSVELELGLGLQVIRDNLVCSCGAYLHMGNTPTQFLGNVNGQFLEAFRM